MHVVLVVDDELVAPNVQAAVQTAVGDQVQLHFFCWDASEPAEKQLGRVSDALEAESDLRPTALLLDVMFPMGDGTSKPLGMQLARELSARSVPVVVMSDKPDEFRSTNDRLAFLPKTKLADLKAVLDQMLVSGNAIYRTKLPGSERISPINSVFDRCATIVNGLFPLDEVMNPHELKQLFDSRPHPTSLWGVAPKSPLHIGYDRFFLKQIDLIRCGCDHTILLADLHVQLNDPEINVADLSLRTAYYQEAMSAVFGLSKAKFVLGSSFQFNRDYISRLLSCLAEVRAIRAYKATPTTVTDPAHLVSWQSKGQAATPKYEEFPADIGDRSLANLAYPVLQALDVYHQKADIALGDFGQKQIYANIGRDAKLRKYLAFDDEQKPPVLLFLENGTDIQGKPLMQSRQRDRITFHETHETLERKVMSVVAAEYSVNGNPLLDICRYSVLPWIDGPLNIERQGRHSLEIHDFEQLAHFYRLGHIHPSDLKQSVIAPLWTRISEFGQHFAKDEKRHLVSWIDVRSQIENILVQSPKGGKPINEKQA